MVYRYLCDSEHYHSLLFESSPPEDWLADFNGQSQINGWEPLRVRLNKEKALGDFAYLAGHIPTFSEKALKCLLPFIESSVEVLPLQLIDQSDTTFYAINVTRSVDCLDRDASKLDLFSNHIMNIRHHVFKPGSLEGLTIFRIGGYELGGCYVSDQFRAAVETNGLLGLLWEPLDKWE
ncbi:imm11 family protein [Aurantivibrio plasticivorans]